MALEPAGDIGRRRARLDFANDRRGRLVQRINLLRLRFEQHSAELFFAEFYVFCELHAVIPLARGHGVPAGSRAGRKPDVSVPPDVSVASVHLHRLGIG